MHARLGMVTAARLGMVTAARLGMVTDRAVTGTRVTVIAVHRAKN